MTVEEELIAAKARVAELEADVRALGGLLNLVVTKKRMELADLEAHYFKANGSLSVAKEQP